MHVFANVVAVSQPSEPKVTSDGRKYSIVDVTLSIPEVRTGQTTGSPYLDGQLITASLFLNDNEKCNLLRDHKIVAELHFKSVLNSDQSRYFNSIRILRYVNLADIHWSW